MTKFSGKDALLTHMLEGNFISILEAMLLFGVANPSAEFTRMRKSGYFIKSRRVPFSKIIRRINTFTTCEVPKEIPHKEILMSEYWINK